MKLFILHLLPLIFFIIFKAIIILSQAYLFIDPNYKPIYNNLFAFKKDPSHHFPMDIQQPTNNKASFQSYSINQTHNVVVQNIVQNQQVKFILFHRLDHIKLLYRNRQQHRFLSGLVVAGRNFIKVYAVFSNSVYEELASYKIYEDITGVYSWDKCIVVQTRKNIVGLIYQDSILKNAFMLSLQFLPLTAKDTPTCTFDKHGFLFTILIKNFLLICFSDIMIAKFKTKPLYKEFTQLITEDIKWNRAQKTYIQEVVKIKLSDFELSKVYNMNICNQALYFIGLKNFQKPNQQGEFSQLAFYHLQTPMFFVENKAPVVQFLAKKDEQVKSMIPYVFSKQMECLFCKRYSIYVQIGRQMVLVDEFQTEDYKILHRSNNEYFSLWVKIGNVIKAYYRSGNKFFSHVIGVNFYFQNFLLKEQLGMDEGTIIYSNETQLSMLKVDLQFVKKIINKNNNEIQEETLLTDKNIIQIHKSFGNVVDFQFLKNSIFVLQSRLSHDDSQHSQSEIKSRLYELKRGLVTDPKPYITHEKKNYLEDLLNKGKFRSIKTLKFRFSPQKGQQSNNYTDNIIVTQSHSMQNRFIFYRQLLSDVSKQGQVLGFEKVQEGISYYSNVIYDGKDYLALVNSNGEFRIEKQGSSSEQETISKRGVQWRLLQQFTHHNKLSHNIFFIDNYLIYQVSHPQNLLFKFLQIFKLQSNEISFPTSGQVMQVFMSKKRQSFRKKDKNSLVIEVTLIYRNSMEVLQFNPESKQVRVVYKCEGISKGLPYLSNYANHNVQDTSIFQKDRLRSITCPQYILSQYHTSLKQQHTKVAGIYTYHSTSYLFLINSQIQLTVYKKCLSFYNECGFIYKRLILPLNIIKHFKYVEDQRVVDQIGEGMVRICNVIICKGQFLEHNVNHISYFQMDCGLWTIEKDKIKMIDIKPLAGSNQPLFRHSQRKDSKDFSYGTSTQTTKSNQTLQDSIQIMSNFILTPIRTMMRKQLMGLQISSDYLLIYSKSGFQVLNQKDMKPVWACNLSAENPQRKEVIINVKAYEHYIAVSYYDYILDQNTEFKSIKFKFRIYNILSKKKILEKPKTTDQPILHIRPISAERILIATSSTLYIYQIKGEKTLQPIRTRNFSKRFGLSTFSYIPEVFDEKNRSHKPCYMLCANQFGGLSFFVGKWLQNDVLREMWFQKLRCHVRNVQLFIYGEALKALITDQDSNLIVINLKPDTPQQAAKAQKIADMNVGSRANVLRVRHEQDPRVYGCFEDGTIKSISAVKLDNPEISLIDFQEETFCKEIPLMGGFNQRVSRLLNQKYRTYKYVSRGNMLDCDILEDFFSMTTNLKQYILEKSEFRIQQLKGILRSI